MPTTPGRPEKRWSWWLALAAGALALWAVATWPVPREFGRAVPHSDYAPGGDRVGPPCSGDYLQLMYHMWLGLDALEGRSPFFTNVYEFNRGTDEGHRNVDWYYLPFSAVYLMLSRPFGHAAGWNAAQACSALASVFFLWLWARRHAKNRLAALLAALAAAAVPYRWVTLLCGSPTGFGMAFPPLVAWGLDVAVRDGKKRGWVALVAGMVCSYMSDLHVFYFTGLAIGPLFALSWLRGARDRGGWRPQWRVAWGGFWRLWPLWLPLGIGGALALLGVHRNLSGSVMKTGRTIFEMASYSPAAAGLVDRHATGMARHVYLGWPLLALLAVSGAASWKRRRRLGEPGLLWWLSLLLCAGVALLALGINAPPVGLWVRAARKIVPGYMMIRQVAKAFVLMPAFLAPLLADGLGALFDSATDTPKRSAARIAAAFAAALAVWAAIDGAMQTKAGLAVIPDGDGQFAGILRDAETRADPAPRALGIPLWPGDSHYSSLCEFATMSTGIRWVNGYSPTVPADYKKNVYLPFEAMNQGFADDARLDALLAMGVRYLVLFPRAAPEKVSPWPPGVTLRRFAENPRLQPLWDIPGDAPMQTFSFRILEPGETRGPVAETWADRMHPSAWHWKRNPPPEIGPGERRPHLMRSPMAPSPGWRLVLRVSPRGGIAGLAPVAADFGDALPADRPPAPDVSFPTRPEGALRDWETLDLSSGHGVAFTAAGSAPARLEHVYAAAGDPWLPDSGGVYRLTPALQWHEGLMRPGRPEAVFDPASTGRGIVLHGPHLPLPAGDYRCTVEFGTGDSPAAAPGEAAGMVRVMDFPARRVFAEAPIPVGGNCVEFDASLPAEDPVRVEIEYFANTRLSVNAVSLRPLPSP